MLAYRGFTPEVSEDCFVAPGAIIIGKAKIGKKCNIWYNAVIRADEEPIVIGDYSNIQDGCVVHVTKGIPTTIGKGVTVGHNAIVHGATIGDYTLVGMGSTVLDGAKVGKNCLIGANALVTGGTIIPDGSLVIGAPAKVVRALTEEEIKSLYDSADNYVSLAEEHKEANA